MPPKHVEDAAEIGGDRVEQLANNFAAALLMPRRVVARFAGWRRLDSDALVDRLNRVASELKVTSSALRWRLVTLGELPVSRARSIRESSLRNNGGLAVESARPALFSKTFVDVLGTTLEQGRVSARRAAEIVDTEVTLLPALFAAHGVEYQVDL